MNKERLEFGLAMGRHSTATLHDLTRLLRYGATYHRLQETACERMLTDKERKQEVRTEEAIEKLCASFGASVEFQGDPRGCTVKIQVSDGYTNDWGKTGICVPTA